MASTLTLTITGAGVANESLDFTGLGDTLTYKLTRTQSKQVNIKDTIEKQIESLVFALEVDYNSTKIYNIGKTATTITIEHFDNTHFDNFVDATHNGMSNVTTAVTTDAQKVSVTVSNAFSAATANKCAYVKSTITFNVAPEKLKVRSYSLSAIDEVYVDITDNANTVVSYDVRRDHSTLEITYQKTGQALINYIISIPRQLVINAVNTQYTEYGGYVNIESTQHVGSETYEYAITSNAGALPSSYSSSPYFSGIEPGDYVAIMRDGYGCSVSKTFTMGDDLAYVARDYEYFVSTKNSTFSVYRDTALTANPFNFLEEELPHLVGLKGTVQTWGDHQKITEQFRSGYEINRVFLVPCNGGNEIEIPVIQKSDNIRRNTRLQGNITENVFGKMEISFNTGDIYDANGNVIGTHNYDGTLPPWYEQGTEVFIDGFAGVITGLNITEGGDSAFTNIDYTADLNGVQIESIHKELGYETYEFELDLTDVQVGGELPEVPYNFRWRLECETTQTTGEIIAGKTHLSGVQSVIPKADLINDKYHLLEYWSDSEDTEIDYSTGIKHKRNVRFSKPPKRVSGAEIESESLGYKTLKVDYKVKRVFEIELDLMPTGQAATLMDGIDGTDYLLIDGMLTSTIEPVTIEHNGQYSKLNIKVAVIELRNEKRVTARSIPSYRGFYPVVT